MNVNIQKSNYQKSKKQKDTDMYITDNEWFDMYTLDIHSDYFTESKRKALELMVKDLETLTKEIKKHINKEYKINLDER